MLLIKAFKSKQKFVRGPLGMVTAAVRNGFFVMQFGYCLCINISFA